jgi:hypothetical protein
MTAFQYRTPYPPISLGALALLAAACGGSSRSDAMPATTEPVVTTTEADLGSNVGAPSASVPSGELAIIVPPLADGSLPADLWVGCENGPEFQVQDLGRIVRLSDADPGGVAQAIEPFLSSEEGQSWPQEDWQILRQTDEEALLVHEGAGGLSFMSVERAGEAWMWSGSQMGGACPLHYVVPEGLNAVDWRLDPEVARDASATTLAVLVTERECVSGQAIGDRLRGPQVVMTDDVVRLAFAAEPPPGDVSCPGNPEARVTVELPAPLGDRDIIEDLSIGIALEDYLAR